MLASFGLVDTGDGQPVFGALLFQGGDEEGSLLTLLDPPVTLPLDQVASDVPGTTFTPVIVSLTSSTQEEELLPGSPIALDQARKPSPVRCTRPASTIAHCSPSTIA